MKKLCLILFLPLSFCTTYAQKEDPYFSRQIFMSIEGGSLFRSSKTSSKNGHIRGSYTTDVSLVGFYFSTYTPKKIGYEFGGSLETFSYKYEYDDKESGNGGGSSGMTNLSNTYRFTLNVSYYQKIFTNVFFEPFLGFGIFITSMEENTTSVSKASSTDENGNVTNYYDFLDSYMTMPTNLLVNGGFRINIINKSGILASFRFNYIHGIKYMNESHVYIMKNGVEFDSAVIYRNGGGYLASLSVKFPIVKRSF
jgi:hypothetical protein